ncbi:hypothetical protein LZ318_33700 [Saccharopolyspora indica]|uniref:effector-associated constant component EACC1 n=1 Tax=Saccharopolyspora indica TaxID=1229659 RepID=UPI0022EB1BC1|nr:hypothetical protein [Saccharopolyspora indica]MDA3649733.1 hypothetical protein [Saccharopolyspora indica]
MDGPAELRIEIVDGSDYDTLALREWLRSQPELRQAVTLAPGLEPDVNVLHVELSSAHAISAFAVTVNGYLRSYRDVSIEISTASHSARFRGDIEQSDVEALLTARTATFDGANNAVRSANVTTVHYKFDSEGVQFQNVSTYMVGGTSHPKWRGSVTRGSATGGSATRGSQPPAPGQAETTTHPVTIYLSDEGVHEQVEAAVEELLASAGLHIEDREDPVLGSWFRRMWATVRGKVSSPAGREATMLAAHAAETRLVIAPDADVTAKLLQGVGPVIQSLEPTKDAVIRVGNVLIVKVDWVVTVSQLTAAQQFLLNHNPDLACSPQQILAALKAEGGDQPPALR